MAKTNTNRLEAKLESCFVKNEYYEAHQIYRTLFYRLSSPGNFDRLLTLLEAGVLRMIQVSEFGSAYDLAEVYGETLIKSGTPVTNERLTEIEKIFRGLPAHIANEPKTNDDKDRRVKYIALVVKWSQVQSVRAVDKFRGSAVLHSRLAVAFWEEGAFDEARAHFMLSDQPEKFGELLVEHYNRVDLGQPAEAWITLAVLQLICLRRVAFAQRVLASYASSTKGLKLSSPPYQNKLLNFTWMLLHIVPTRNLANFTALVGHFRSELTDEYLALVDQIGQSYVGLAPKNPQGGMIGNLLKGLLGGGGGGESDQQQKNNLPTSDDEDEAIKVLSRRDPKFEAEFARILKADAPVMEQHDDDLD